MSTPVTSQYVDVADRPWTEQRPGVFWKVLWTEGDRKALHVLTPEPIPPSGGGEAVG